MLASFTPLVVMVAQVSTAAANTRFVWLSRPPLKTRFCAEVHLRVLARLRVLAGARDEGRAFSALAPRFGGVLWCLGQLRWWRRWQHTAPAPSVGSSAPVIPTT